MTKEDKINSLLAELVMVQTGIFDLKQKELLILKKLAKLDVSYKILYNWLEEDLNNAKKKTKLH